ncbi:hypothetical protein QWZ08_25650 [Ferruginibacter paludis]|uniref:hypothetical protein n=1 Tax=Ferruginibacter paludis TaxID=1310417 RepID=UPI0025B4E253|nr:hypothetical protein [Ferruginibacter paludis]MDN3659055.1 hypothetical protein [Ferruginibacter paludis]
MMKQSTPNIFRLRFSGSLLITICCLLFSSCQKDSFITSQNAQLSTSVDSLKYDTVFTSIGSITQSFKISNPNNQKLLLSTVKLMAGPASAFKININGSPSDEANNIEIAANDSIYVFVTIHVNPTFNNLPFVVKDSIMISYNGNTRFVQLQAYGQNANFLKSRVIKGDVKWSSPLPYVLLGSLHIESGATLTIDSGCKIYSHADAPVIVDGTLIINGTKEKKVIFSGDRLDADYKSLPASWPGIYFRESSKNNVLTYAIVKNAYQAVVAEKPSVNSNPKLVLHQCIIDNAYDAGLLCVNSSVDADNSLITNCGTNIGLTYGGKYHLTNCTVAAYSTSYITHKKPVLTVTDYATLNGATLSADLNAVFRNCIFWSDNSSVDNEVATDKQGSGAFNVVFDHCLYKAKEDPINCTITEAVKNQDPLFDSVDVAKQLFDFHINNSLAPGIDKGIGGIGFVKDLDDNKRSVGLPDIGCYEKQ